MPIYEVHEKLITYRPADIYKNKSGWAIRYYVINPATDNLHRKQIKLNRIKNKTERLAYAKQLCFELNRRLASGWNPFFEQVGRLSHHSITDAVEAYLAYKKQDLRPATMKSYISLSGKLLEWWKRNKSNIYISSFSTRDAQQILDDYYRQSKKITPRTYNNHLKFFKTLFEWFVERDYIKDNPFNYIKIKRVETKKRTIIPAAVRLRIKEYLSTDPYYYVCQLVYRCFLRPKEISMLQIKHIDFESRIIEISAEISKNHNARYVPISDDVFQYLEKIKDLSLDTYIFSTGCRPSKKMSAPTLYGKRWDKLRTALNLPMEYQLYSLKDTGITEMLEAGVPAKLVQELADHHSLEMTQKYVHKSNVKEILKYDVLRF